jgi:3-oxoacyl-[acyl-carrier protein] reductase
MKPRVLVSGGSRGIGRETALYLSDSHEVTTFARGEVTEHLNDPRAPKVRHVSGIDVRRAESIESLDAGTYDCLVNNVGIAYDGLLATQSIESIEDVLRVNLLSVMSLTKWFLRGRLAVRRPGVIVNIGSIVAIRGYSGLAAYSASKAGLEGLTRSLARELGGKGFRVNCLLPGYVETELSKNLSEPQKQQIVRRTPLGRLATSADIAPVVEFLLSDRSRFITGQSIVVDGGLTA